LSDGIADKIKVGHGLWDPDTLLSQRGGGRFLIRPTGADMIDDLYDSCPNFSDVIDDLKKYVALSVAGNEPMSFTPILLLGEPGIGKSTIVAQIGQAIGAANPEATIIYVSGEESAGQLKNRLDRLPGKAKNLKFIGETNADKIISTAKEAKPILLIVDSIQTVYTNDVAAEAGDVVLTRSNPMDAARLIILSKKVYGKMIQNLIWALGYNVVAIPAAAGAFASLGFFLRPEIGAIIMSMSTVIVVANALTLKRIKL